MKTNKAGFIIRLFCQVSFLVVISKMLGFIRQMVVAATFGATIETDLISLAEGLTGNIEYVLSQAIITAFIPIYILEKKKSEKSGKQFIASSLYFLSLFIFVLSLIIFVFSSILAKVIAPSYNSDLHKVLTYYIRILSPLLILYGMQSIFHASLNANERYISGQIIGLNQSIIIILCTLLFGQYIGVEVLIISFFVYSIVNVFFLALSSRKYWWKASFSFKLTNEIKTLLKMMGPLLLGYSVVFVNQQVDKIIVSGMTAGTITAMSYGASLSNFVTSIIGAVCSVIYTRISIKIANTDNRGVNEVVSKSLIIFITALLPITLITILSSDIIVSIVFGRGAFNSSAVFNAARSLSGYAFLFIPYALKALFSQFQYGKKDMKTPMVNNCVGIFFNIIFSILLYKPLGVFGVTFSTSMADMISAFLNLKSAKKKGYYNSVVGFFSWVIVWGIGGVVCLLVILLIRRFSFANLFVHFFMTAGGAIVAYAFVIVPKLYKSWNNLRIQ